MKAAKDLVDNAEVTTEGEKKSASSAKKTTAKKSSATKTSTKKASTKAKK